MIYAISRRENTGLPGLQPRRTRRVASLVAAGLSVALAAGSAVEAGTRNAWNSTAAIIARTAPYQGMVTNPDHSAPGSATAPTRAGLLTLPADIADPLILVPGDSLTAPIAVTLPSLGSTGQAGEADDGTMVYRSAESGADVAVQVFGNGGIRLQSVLRAAHAPRAFSYSFGGDVVAVLEPNGGVDLRRATGDGVQSAGRLEPPRAKDANGQPVPTHYTVAGGTVTQHVTPMTHHVYPIVADPFWIPALGVFARFTAHAIQRMAARKVSEELVKQTVLNGVRTPGSRVGTSLFTQGSGANKIQVIVADKTGNIITVTRG